MRLAAIAAVALAPACLSPLVPERAQAQVSQPLCWKPVFQQSGACAPNAEAACASYAPIYGQTGVWYYFWSSSGAPRAMCIGDEYQPGYFYNWLTNPSCPTGTEATFTGCLKGAQWKARRSCDARLEGQAFGSPATPNPVDLATGDKMLTAVDYADAGVRPFQVERRYSYQSAQARGSLGFGWTLPIDSYLALNTGQNQATVILHGGEGFRFNKTANGWEHSPTSQNRGDTLVFLGDVFEWRAADGEIYTFAPGAFLIARITKWRAADGYGWNLTYEKGNAKTLLDTYGRTMTFEWSSEHRPVAVVTKIKVTGYEIVYNYDEVPATSAGPQDKRLKTVTRLRTATGESRSIGYLYTDPDLPYAVTGAIDERAIGVGTFAYDDHGRVVSSTLNGVTHAVAYNDVDGSRSVTGPLGKTDVYAFGLKGGRQVMTAVNGLATPNCPASTQTLTYTSGVITAAVDEKGNRTNYTRDSRGRETSSTEGATTAVARTTGTTWHGLHAAPTRVVEPGLTVDLTYDANGQVLTRTETDTDTSGN